MWCNDCLTESCGRPSRLLLYTGILTVGVGDAVVSFDLKCEVWLFTAVADYEDAGICGGEKGGAIQVVTYNTQDFRRKCQFHNLSGGVCVGTARLWVG